MTLFRCNSSTHWQVIAYRTYNMCGRATKELVATAITRQRLTLTVHPFRSQMYKTKKDESNLLAVTITQTYSKGDATRGEVMITRPRLVLVIHVWLGVDCQTRSLHTHGCDCGLGPPTTRICAYHSHFPRKIVPNRAEVDLSAPRAAAAPLSLRASSGRRRLGR